MKQIKISMFALIALAAVVFSSCKKEEAEVTPTEKAKESFIKESETMSAYFNDVYQMADKAVIDNGGRYKDVLACGTVKFDKDKKTLDLDFGTADCTGPDGKIRKGKISLVWEGIFGTNTFKRTLTFANYSVNGDVLSGVMTVSGWSKNTAGLWQYTQKITDGVLTYKADGKKAMFASDFTIVWLEGEGTKDWGKYVYEISGSASGTTKDGETYTYAITSPLKRKGACGVTGIYYAVQGKTKITAGTGTPIEIDYGTGACDKKVTITYGKLVYEYDLP